MRQTYLILILILSTMAYTDVMSGTKYEFNCYEFDSLLQDWSINDVSTCIEEHNDAVYYAAYFEGDYGFADEEHFLLVASVALCAGYISKDTDWSSDYSVCIFADKVIQIRTEACREMADARDAGYSDDVILEYYNDNSLVLLRPYTEWGE